MSNKDKSKRWNEAKAEAIAMWRRRKWNVLEVISLQNVARGAAERVASSRVSATAGTVG